jgi:hypothetical protein
MFMMLSFIVGQPAKHPQISVGSEIANPERFKHPISGKKRGPRETGLLRRKGSSQ